MARRGSRIRRTMWMATTAVLTIVAVGTAIVAGVEGDRSTVAPVHTIASPSHVWCASDHEPSVPSLHHEMPAGMRMTMVMPPLPTAECRGLHQQVLLAAKAAMRFPTLADAKRAGYQQVGYFFPGMGLHMARPQGISTVFDPSAPTFLLYDGTKPAARVSGLAYEIKDPTGAIPTFFVGNHDMPHSHAFCPKQPSWSDTRVPGQPGCSERDVFDANTWMIDAWVVPGRSSPWGLFSSLNLGVTWQGFNAAASDDRSPAQLLYLVQGPKCGLS